MARKTKRYWIGVEFIALNDDPSENDLDEIANQISVVLLSEIFEIEDLEVAKDVAKIREEVFGINWVSKNKDDTK